MNAILLMGAAGLTLASTSAHAQDTSGFRLEARVDGGQSSAEAVVSDPDDEEGDEFLVGSENDFGAAYGFELGHGALFGKGVVVGAYAGLDLPERLVCSELFGGDLVCAEPDRTTTLGVRGGVPGSVIRRQFSHLCGQRRHSLSPGPPNP